ncbi:hypothetical protein [methane-oxidizing endosymbiont of Gigantopelta aegis]|uniref:hypothetical protein n=1 Tax=methane-oxidizing endosymbiont of Gigantopelta aegis TaxID=2794938 RepID=UPI0018DD8A40|nr:hypothetical protein [methane-oxidizing endosymbiont of Gigantopelta aegis]
MAIAKQERLEKIYQWTQKDENLQALMLQIKQVRRSILEKALRDEYLNKALRLIGYGGLIHDFKNYLIRKDPIYYQKFITEFQNLSVFFSKGSVR